MSQKFAETVGQTALYAVDVTFDIEPMGDQPAQHAVVTLLVRMQVEEVRRLADADRVVNPQRVTDLTFRYPGRTSAPRGVGRIPTNGDRIQPPRYLSRDHPTTIGMCSSHR